MNLESAVFSTFYSSWISCLVVWELHCGFLMVWEFQCGCLMAWELQCGCLMVCWLQCSCLMVCWCPCPMVHFRHSDLLTFALDSMPSLSLSSSSPSCGTPMAVGVGIGLLYTLYCIHTIQCNAFCCHSVHVITYSLTMTLYRVLPVSHICWKVPKWQLVLFSELLVISTIQDKQHLVHASSKTKLPWSTR